MHKILLLGATGGLGREVLAQALEKFNVTVLVRDPARMPAATAPVTIIQGDILRDTSRLDDAVRGQDAVVSVLGVGKSFKPSGLIAQAGPALVNSMQRHGVRRLVFTSAFGVGPTWADTPLIPRLFMLTLLRAVYADKEKGEASIHSSPLDWTIVYPAGLTNGPRTDRVRVAQHLVLKGFPNVSRADVAAVILRLIDDPTSIRKNLLVAN